jgi:hypothetical protein
MTITCLAAWGLALLLLPLIVIIWATESRSQRIHRLRRQGWSQQRIASHLQISRYQVRLALS